MRKVSPTRLELRRQRERLGRFRRFLPALQLRQQQLQRALEATRIEVTRARGALATATERLEGYRSVLGDLAGLDLVSLSRPGPERIRQENVAGVPVPVLERLTFPPASYSLLSTPPWVDATLQDMRAVEALRSEVEVLGRREAVLARELIRVIQRVNLFEKVKIPEAEGTIHRIRIHLGDEMAAAVGRAKIAKARQGPEADGTSGRGRTVA